jgi:hypothetical protein
MIVSNPFVQNLQAEIVGTTGKTHWQGELPPGVQTISLPAMANGIYFLRWRQNSGQGFTRFIYKP